LINDQMKLFSIEKCGKKSKTKTKKLKFEKEDS
jgi:hypothetical protein